MLTFRVSPWNRKRVGSGVLLVVALALLGLSGAAAFLSAWRAPPPIDVSPGTEIDLGTVAQGTTTRATFTIGNRSSDPVEIVRVVTTCGCSAGAPEKPVLERGESTALHATFVAGSSRGDVAVRVVVLYRAGKPEHRELARLDLGLRAFVDPDFVWSAETLTFEGSRPETRSIVISPNRMSELEVSEVYCTHKAFHAHAAPADREGHRTYRVDVAFVPEDWTRGTESAELIVRTNSPAEPRGRVALHVGRRR